MLLIPNAINNFIFELRESCRQIDGRTSIVLMQYNAVYDRRFWVYSQTVGRGNGIFHAGSSNVKLFVAFGITWEPLANL